MASRLASVSKNIFGKAFYSNLWIAISFGLISQVIGYTKYEGYFDLYWIIMKDGYLSVSYTHLTLPTKRIV